MTEINLSAEDQIQVLKRRIQFWHRRAMELRGQSRTVRDQDYLDGQLELAQHLLTEVIQMQGGQELMDISNNPLIVKVVRLSDIKVNTEDGESKKKVIALCDALGKLIEEAKRSKEDVPAIKVNTKELSYQALGNILSDLRKQKKVEGWYTVSKRGEDVYLVKKEGRS